MRPRRRRHPGSPCSGADDGRAEGRQRAGARDQGSAGDGRLPGHESGGRARNPAHRLRAQRDLAVPVGGAARERAPPDHHRQRRPVLGPPGARPRSSDRRAGPQPPAMVDGPEGDGRLGDPHEQGARAHRGASPLRHAAGADRRGDPSAECCPFCRGVRRRLAEGADRAAGHAPSDRRRARVSRPPRRRCAFDPARGPWAARVSQA